MQHTFPNLARYIETLTVPSGDLAGQPLAVWPWERRFLRGAFRADGDVALSVARGNGKSALVASIATAAVDPDGPLQFGRADVVCCASSFDQSRVVFEDVLAYLRDRHGDLPRKTWRLQDSANRATIEHRPTGARVRCIGSDPKRAHGLRPALVLADEPAQWERTKAEAMLAALRTGLGKIPGSRLIALGTRPADREHWFARMLREAAYAQNHAVPAHDKTIFQARTWARANPSLRFLPSLAARIRAEAAEAKRDPSLLPSFRALRLNQGVTDVSEALLLSAGTWDGCEGKADAAGRFVLGIDLGTSAAMSAAAAFWPDTGKLSAFAVFPEKPDLRERGLRDGCGRLYSDMARRGELIQAGRHVSDIGALLTTAAQRWGRPAAVVCDRWREAELRQHAEAARVRLPALTIRGQGFRDGGEDVRDFRRACLGGGVRAETSLLLRAALSEARVLMDPAGNAKLAKSSQAGRRQRARDDAAAAAIVAVAHGWRLRRVPKRPRWRYRGVAG